ncbi:MAG: hypothetical protein MMC33_010475 [Icmadophila ericetorum]|nr:hypothetical protein [Icmadophila ericetorum]
MAMIDNATATAAAEYSSFELNLMVKHLIDRRLTHNDYSAKKRSLLQELLIEVCTDVSMAAYSTAEEMEHMIAEVDDEIKHMDLQEIHGLVQYLDPQLCLVVDRYLDMISYVDEDGVEFIEWDEMQLHERLLKSWLPEEHDNCECSLYNYSGVFTTNTYQKPNPTEYFLLLEDIAIDIFTFNYPQGPLTPPTPHGPVTPPNGSINQPSAPPANGNFTTQQAPVTPLVPQMPPQLPVQSAPQDPSRAVASSASLNLTKFPDDMDLYDPYEDDDDDMCYDPIADAEFAYNMTDSGPESAPKGNRIILKIYDPADR